MSKVATGDWAALEEAARAAAVRSPIPAPVAQSKEVVERMAALAQITQKTKKMPISTHEFILYRSINTYISLNLN